MCVLFLGGSGLGRGQQPKGLAALAAAESQEEESAPQICQVLIATVRWGVI